MNYQTEQENFRSGDFSDAYTEGNQGAEHEAGPLFFFAKVCSYALHIGTAAEFGANRGLNLITLCKLMPQVDLATIEINESVVSHLRTLPCRGHEEWLFKRDFAGKIFALIPNLALSDFGYLYRRDPLSPEKDISWRHSAEKRASFLMLTA